MWLSIHYSYLIDKAHHHLTHVDEIFSRHIIIVHDSSLNLSEDLISEILSLLPEAFNLLGRVRQYVLKSLGRVPFDLLSGYLILGINPPSYNVLFLE